MVSCPVSNERRKVTRPRPSLPVVPGEQGTFQTRGTRLSHAQRLPYLIVIPVRSRRRRARRHGFRHRMATKAGRAVVRNRRAKGRQRLSA